jgi:hypothetical protein
MTLMVLSVASPARDARRLVGGQLLLELSEDALLGSFAARNIGIKRGKPAPQRAMNARQRARAQVTAHASTLGEDREIRH